jgi:hypothetical protein
MNGWVVANKIDRRLPKIQWTETRLKTPANATMQSRPKIVLIALATSNGSTGISLNPAAQRMTHSGLE